MERHYTALVETAADGTTAPIVTPGTRELERRNVAGGRLVVLATTYPSHLEMALDASSGVIQYWEGSL